MRAKKSLGQNFLIDQNYQGKIVSAVLNVHPQILLEIGPGREALTQHFVGKVPQLFLAEKDRELIEVLNQKYADHSQVTVLAGDFLEIDPMSYRDLIAVSRQMDPAVKPRDDTKCVAVGNLPYNVASQIFIRLLENHSQLSHLFLMFQKEMALRFVAKPRTKDYGLLSLWAQIYTQPKILFHLPPTVFRPQPKVDSSFVYFEVLEKPLISDEEAKDFWPLMRTLFQQRRKTMGAVLKKKKIALPESYQKVRAEELMPQELIQLFLLL